MRNAVKASRVDTLDRCISCSWPWTAVRY